MSDIAPTALVAPDAVIGSESIVEPFCVIGVNGSGEPVRIAPGATIRSHTVVYRGTQIGEGFHAGHGVLVREETRIGHGVSVGSHSVIEHHVELRDGVRLHSGCFVPELSVLEEEAWLGPGVIVTNARYPNRPDTKEKLEGVRIGRSAVIGAGAVLLPGLRIGARAMVGAGAVVVRNVPDSATVVGNPARRIDA